MKLTNLFNEGACGIEQALYIGKIKFNSTGAATGITLAEVPANHVITRAVCKVTEEFDAGTTNVLTLGTDESIADLLGANAVMEDTPGVYQAQTWLETGATQKTVKAKYAQTGDAAEAGEAEFYLFVLRLPE